MIYISSPRSILCEESEQNLNEKCPYKDTVDLSDMKPLENGSYVYHNILIDDSKLAQYDYRLGAYDKRQKSELHWRGCVCDETRYCVKVCCQWGEFFNENTYECEKISADLNVPTDLLIISTDNNDDDRVVNIYEHFIYQIGLPCKYGESYTSEDDEWHLMEDGTLYIKYDNTYLDTVSYCLTPYRYNDANENVLVPMICPTKNTMTSELAFHCYAALVTVLFLIPTVGIYLWLRELRENMRGKLLICYLISLIICYSILSYINLTELTFGENMCSILGFTCYFFFIAAFLWLSVLCFDIWINFKDHRVANNANKNFRRFIWYSCYAWGLAAILTILTMCCQWSENISNEYKPGIGHDSCWLDTNKWSAAIYFYWPNLIILIFSIATFIQLTMRIYRVRSDVAQMTQGKEVFKENAVVILRVFIILGLSWILDILSYYLRDYGAGEFLSLLSDLRCALQGLLIFILFVLKGNVLKSIKKRLHNSGKPSLFARLSFSKSSISHGPQTEHEYIEVNLREPKE
ncbi:G-protein coupled receptor Mth2-like [Musca autumnalis]|uniref:G-protein coupled receptor Mth2-like n=1 Tax=Musca autumnalis TaxID=221902 RepID=UPI003CF86D1C